jgi:hypothetical protein
MFIFGHTFLVHLLEIFLTLVQSKNKNNNFNLCNK